MAKMNGWLFKAGNDTAWAKKEIDISGLKKLKPTQISDKLADKLKKAEGWFRIKIKTDSSFRDEPIGFNIDSWAAIDLYVDGRLVSYHVLTGSLANILRINARFDGVLKKGRLHINDLQAMSSI
ncbi:MAG TPA: hypothetical protein VKR32_06960 [Puia sp.]|nr:hypothetical protein [Puia sp.]